MSTGDLHFNKAVRTYKSENLASVLQLFSIMTKEKGSANLAASIVDGSPTHVEEWRQNQNSKVKDPDQT